MSNCQVWEELGKRTLQITGAAGAKALGWGDLREARVPGVELEKGGVNCHRRAWRNNRELVIQDFVNHNMEFGFNLQTVGLCKQRNNRNGKCFKSSLLLLWGEDKKGTREFN